VVHRRSRQAYGIVADRIRIADSSPRQLQALGLERRSRVKSLNEYLVDA
jgi:hypothetical protein